MLYSVYQYGILSKENLRKNNIPFLRDNESNVRCNGKDYISVCKKLDHNSFSYHKYINTKSAFIIRDDIPKIKRQIEEIKLPRSKILTNILGPKIIKKEICIVNNKDEYLVKDKIGFDDIIGLKLPCYYEETDIFNLINFLIKINYNLPIIDVERHLEINQKKMKRRRK